MSFRSSSYAVGKRDWIPDWDERIAEARRFLVSDHVPLAEDRTKTFRARVYAVGRTGDPGKLRLRVYYVSDDSKFSDPEFEPSKYGNWDVHELRDSTCEASLLVLRLKLITYNRILALVAN